jgi:hypothetical protein
LLGTLADHGLFTDFYDLLSGSNALLNNAGIKDFGIPAVASNGIVPAEAYHGDMITMTGINLSAINKVQFAGSPTTTTGITPTARTVTVAVHPNAITGTILLMDAVPHFIFTIQKLKIKTVTTPNAPTNLQGTGTSTSSITLTWNDVVDEDNYRIEYKKSEDDTYIILDTINANVTSYVVENLLCNNAYDFQVIALGRGTQSAPSTITQLKPLSLDVPVINSSSTESCTGSSIVISAPAGFASYHWSNDETTQTINAESSGDYSVQVTDANGCVSDYSQPVVITFYNYPDATISQTDNVLQTSVVADSYQWYYNSNPIANGMTSSLTLTQSGTYQLELSNHGCASWSREIVFVAPVTTGVEENVSESISVFPNPSNGKFTVRVPTSINDYRITIFNLVGKTIYQYSGNGKTQIEVPNASVGLYLLVIESNKKILTQKIIFN